MPIEAFSRTCKPASLTLDLPPPFRLVTLREAGDAFRHATTIAAQEGAGALVHVGRFDLVEFAVVLEPEEPLRIARRAFYAAMIAVLNALATYAPPQRPISIVWPDAIRVDGDLIGGARLAWPPQSDEEEPPAWLAFGVILRRIAMGDQKTGLEKESNFSPLAPSLEDHGFDDPGPLVATFARHLMTIIDAWQANGFDIVAHDYLAHLTHERGVRPTIDVNGDLMLRWIGKEEPDRHSLAQALEKPSWLDPATRGPRG